MKKRLTLAAAVLSLAFVGQPVAQADNIFTWTQRSLADVIASVKSSVNAEEDYVVQWGDTLYAIAQALDMTVIDLAALNQIDNPDLILAGSTISFNRVKHTVTINNDATYSALTGQPLADAGNQVENLSPITQVNESQWTTPVLAATSTTQDYEEITAAPVTEETTIAPVYPETTWAPVYEETTVVPVVPETIAAPVEEATTAAPVYEETTTTAMPTTVETSTVTTTTVAPTTVEETTAPPVTEETTAAPVEEVTTPPAAEVTTPPVTTGLSAYEAFEAITVQYGVSAQEKEMWSYIINRESGWDPTISNPYSGAYGLPQALPGNKMASHGADWATNPYTQLAWMYDYMVSRYGSITGAYNQSMSAGWY